MKTIVTKCGGLEVIIESENVVVDIHDPTAGREFRGTITVKDTGDSWKLDPALTIEEKLTAGARCDLLGDIVRFVGDIRKYGYNSFDVKLETPGTIKLCARGADDFKMDYGDATVAIYGYLLNTFLAATKP